MEFYDRLLDETRDERQRFLAVPIIGRAADSGVPRDIYLEFLGQAYHHVRHTCPLLYLALARCGPKDDAYRAGLITYVETETGHEQWILDDIDAMGGDAALARDSVGGIPCRAMVGYATYAIEHISPYALLGMVHVLESISAEIAEPAAKAIAKSFGSSAGAGFSYLISHGALDKEHVGFFAGLVNGIRDDPSRRAIIDTANIIYRLYGDIFRDLDHGKVGADAAR